MKVDLIKTAAVAIVLTLPMATYSQGRHDEKPHASNKAEATTSDKPRKAATGGRHDSGATTHGAAKTSKKKEKPAAEPNETTK